VGHFFLRAQYYGTHSESAGTDGMAERHEWKLAALSQHPRPSRRHCLHALGIMIRVGITRGHLYCFFSRRCWCLAATIGVGFLQLCIDDRHFP